jgi:hypothetical protein
MKTKAPKAMQMKTGTVKDIEMIIINKMKYESNNQKC